MPSLLRFNGQPKVSPAGDLVYCLPELQLTAQGPNQTAASIAGTTASDASIDSPQLAAYLEERRWRFSLASRAQKKVIAALGILLLILSSTLFYSVSMLPLGMMGMLAMSAMLAGLATVGIGYSPSSAMRRKLGYAQQFAGMRWLDTSNLIYTSERDLID